MRAVSLSNLTQQVAWLGRTTASSEDKGVSSQAGMVLAALFSLTVSNEGTSSAVRRGFVHMRQTSSLCPGMLSGLGAGRMSLSRPAPVFHVSIV